VDGMSKEAAANQRLAADLRRAHGGGGGCSDGTLGDWERQHMGVGRLSFRLGTGPKPIGIYFIFFSFCSLRGKGVQLYSLNPEIIQWFIFNKSPKIQLNSDLQKLILIFDQLDHTIASMVLDSPYNLWFK
jgi:hypothetical protein